MLRPSLRFGLLIAAALAPPAFAQSDETLAVQLPSRVTFQRPELRHPGKDEPRAAWLARLAAEGRRPVRLRWKDDGRDDPFATMTLDVRGKPAVLPLHVAEPEKWTRMMESLLAASTCPCRGWGAIPGRTPDGKVLRGQQLRLSKDASGQVLMSWGQSCSDAATDYTVHRGNIGSFYSHQSIRCTTGGATGTSVGGAGSYYFLIVPVTDELEGSYGVRSNGNERPGSTPTTCRTQWTAQHCTQDMP